MTMTEPTIQPEPQPRPQVDATNVDSSATDATVVEPATDSATIPAQPPAGHPYPAQATPAPAALAPGATPGQPVPHQPVPGQPYAGQPFPGQQPYAGQAYPGYPAPGQAAYPAQPFPGQAQSPGQPFPGQPYPFGGQSLGLPGVVAAVPPKRKRRTFLIVSLVLVALLVLCGGVATTAYIVSQKQAGIGQSDPQTAVDDFMTAIYTDHDATEARKYVCAQSDDANQIASKIKELKTEASTYDEPVYSWSKPTVSNQTVKEATVTTRVTMTTADEKQSSEGLTFTTTKSNGWWVCEVKSGS